MLEAGDRIPSDRYMIGGSNNLLISPAPPPLMMLSGDFAYIVREGDTVIAGAAVTSGRLLSYAKKHDLGGFEFLAKLPGTVGGMVAMNAGVKRYEIFNILEAVEIDGAWIGAENISHGYRYARLPGIVTAARFKTRYGYDEKLRKELLKLRLNQPNEPSAGSAFKNPPNDYAGRLIEAAGLKGCRVGDMAWSEKHANFLINLGNGTYSDAIKLLELTKKRVYENSGIMLQEEIIILNQHPVAH